MTQKQLQKQCSDTSKEFKSEMVKRKGDKRIYQATDKNGGMIKLIIKIPASKLAQRIRSMLFKKIKRK